jgi:phosphoribosylformylglycinamidine synthase
MRVEISPKNHAHDSPGRAAAAAFTDASGIQVEAWAADVYVIGGTDGHDVPRDVIDRTFVDPVAQRREEPFAASVEGWHWLVEVAYRPGVTDTVGITAREALEISGALPRGAKATVRSARQYLFLAPGNAPDRATAERGAKALYNPLIQIATLVSRAEWDSGARPPERYPEPDLHDPTEPERIDVASMTDAELESLSRGRLLALTLDEMRAVRDHFADPETIQAREALGIGSRATDVEIEMIAQTWSEHCKHKIFNAIVESVEDGRPTRIDSLYKSFVKATTEAVRPRRDFLLSVFSDNAGVVRFTDEWSLCVKAETHNSPSALDPYGGAITGIVGVNRDVLGTGLGAKPIFNTNVLCFGYPDAKAEDIPEGLLHPKAVLRGVHRGIVDGGNQSGIPTAAGAFVFDDSFRGKPLVFCGTGGIMPAKVRGKPSHEKRVRPGTLAVMLGGRVGKDGIHGATFSSLALDETSPVSAVQIGDPIIQRKMTDFLLEARDAGLYESITDNGAGGLSSSLGEMAEGSNGVTIDLDACPLKYPGLSPWEILVSESQERMSLAVAPETLDALLALARRRGVEATVVGGFVDSGSVELRANGKIAGSLPLAFLHGGCPRLTLEARWSAGNPGAGAPPEGADWGAALLAVLSEPNVASKEKLIRRYDHEVQGSSIEKPFTGIERDAPSDGAVLKPLYDDWRGITVTHGICPRYGDHDAFRMAQCAVDEAFRAHVALGGDPERAAALDNFCWPDPVRSETNEDGPEKMGQLVRACRGLMEACVAYGLPLVSGKDSMKNDARAGGKKISVRPTLLVTLMGFIDDVRKATSTDFIAPGDLIYALGQTEGELGGSILARVLGFDGGEAPAVEPTRALSLYRALHKAISGRLTRSAHDVSDGGLAVAIAEGCIGGRLGARVDTGNLPGRFRDAGAPVARALFSESASRFVVTVRPTERERFEETMAGSAFKLIGETTAEPRLTILHEGQTAIDLPLDSVVAAFKKSPE